MSISTLCAHGTDEWGVAALDVAAYLNRIDHPPDRLDATLRELDVHLDAAELDALAAIPRRQVRGEARSS